MGPLLFSLVVMELMDELGPTPEIALQLWYLDDGIFIGICPEVASLLRKLQSAGTSFELQLNAAKCEVFWPSGDQSFLEIPSDVQRVDANKDGAEFVGSPVCGSKEFVNNSLAKRVDRDLECQQLLSDLGNSQVELHLLRSCLSLCKINHLISTVPSDVIESQLSRFDAGLRSSLKSIIHSSIPDLFWKQATLPVRLSGLGLRESTRTAPAAFLASCNSSCELVLQLLSGMQQSAIIPSSSLDQGLSLKGRSVVQDHLRTLLPTAKIDVLTTSQHQLQSLLDSTMWHSIKDNTSLRDRARLNTISAQHAGAWLRAIPNPNTDLTMPHRECVVSLHIWLGNPLFPADLGSKRCSCGQILDKFGDHLLGCGQNTPT